MKIFGPKNFRYKHLSFPGGRRTVESKDELKIIKEIPFDVAVIKDRDGKVLNPPPKPKVKKKGKKSTKKKETQDVQNNNGKKGV